MAGAAVLTVFYFHLGWENPMRQRMEARTTYVVKMKCKPFDDSFFKSVVYVTRGAQMQPISLHCKDDFLAHAIGCSDQTHVNLWSDESQSQRLKTTKKTTKSEHSEQLCHLSHNCPPRGHVKLQGLQQPFCRLFLTMRNMTHHLWVTTSRPADKPCPS